VPLDMECLFLLFPHYFIIQCNHKNEKTESADGWLNFKKSVSVSNKIFFTSAVGFAKISAIKHGIKFFIVNFQSTGLARRCGNARKIRAWT
jgi:hypothetical protein